MCPRLSDTVGDTTFSGSIVFRSGHTDVFVRHCHWPRRHRALRHRLHEQHRRAVIRAAAARRKLRKDVREVPDVHAAHVFAAEAKVRRRALVKEAQEKQRRRVPGGVALLGK